MEKPRSHGESGKPRQGGLDELTVAFSTVSLKVVSALMQGEELRTRDVIFRSASGVIWYLLRSMQYPRDAGLIQQLAKLNITLTEFLDQITLNAGSEDEALQALRELAQRSVTWPTHVRPGDQNFTELKLSKLNVGSKVPADSPASKGKRTRSLATDANRLTLKLVRLLEKHAAAVLRINRNGVPGRSTPEEARQTLLVVLGVPEQKHTQFIEILRRVERYPYSAKTVTEWCTLLTDYILLVDPELEKFPELRAVKNWQRSDELHAVTRWKRSRSVKTASSFRRQLQKFFQKPLQQRSGPTRGS